jgi:hypothetical protein
MNTINLKKILFGLAVTGWSLGLIVHLLSLADFDVTSKVSFVWLLHLGIFVVWLPAVIDLKKNEELKEFQRSGLLNRMNLVAFYKIIFKQTPPWLTVIAIVGFFYALINFALFMSAQTGVPNFKDGQYILQNHGKLIKILTVQEYHHYKANEVRGFSGHWVAFYGIAAAILFPYNKKTALAGASLP